MFFSGSIRFFQQDRSWREVFQVASEICGDEFRQCDWIQNVEELKQRTLSAHYINGSTLQHGRSKPALPVATRSRPARCDQISHIAQRHLATAANATRRDRLAATEPLMSTRRRACSTNKRQPGNATPPRGKCPEFGRSRRANRRPQGRP